MNNIFYEFLEKNQLQGLEEVLDELPLFEELVKFPGLPAGAPQPTSVDLIGTDFNVNGVSYNFYVSNKNNKTYCFITDATMNPLDEQAQKNILVTIMRAGASGKAINQKNIDNLNPAQYNLINPKTGKDQSIVSFNLSVTALRRAVFVYTGVFFKNIKKFTGTVENIKIGKVTPSSQSKEQQSTDMSNDAQGEVKNSMTPTKKGSTMKTEMEARGLFKKQNDEVKSKKLDAMASKAIDTQAERARISKLMPDARIRAILVKNPSLTKELSALTDAIESLSVNENFKKVFVGDKVSYYKDMISKDNNNKEKYLQITDSETRKIIKNVIGITIKSIKPLVKKYGFKNVNEILVAFRPDSKNKIAWFNENYVNNHFTMKRIFNS